MLFKLTLQLSTKNWSYRRPSNERS